MCCPQSTHSLPDCSSLPKLLEPDSVFCVCPAALAVQVPWRQPSMSSQASPHLLPPCMTRWVVWLGSRQQQSNVILPHAFLTVWTSTTHLHVSALPA